MKRRSHGAPPRPDGVADARRAGDRRPVAGTRGARPSPHPHAATAARPPTAAASPSVPALRDRLREATAEAILAAAESVFGEHGVHGARMGDVASRAGVAVGTLYNHFEDRDAMFCALLRARRQELLARLDHALDGGPDQPFDRQLVALLRGIFDHYEAHRSLITMLTRADHSARREPLVARESSETMREVRARFVRLVERGLRQRALRPADADLYPYVLVGLFRSVSLRDAEESPYPGSRAVDQVDRLVRLFLDGARP